MDKIVVLGGSFNPPTRAHMELMRAAVDSIGAAKGIFAPAAYEYVARKMKRMKCPGDTLSEEIRAEALESICKEDARLSVSRIQMESEGRGYDYEMMLGLQKENPGCELYFLVGSDKLYVLSRWHRIDEFLRDFRILVAERGEDDLEKILETRPYIREHRDSFVFFSPPDKISEICSTAFREKLHNGDKTARELVPQGVWEVLDRNGKIPWHTISGFHDEYRFLSNFYEAEVTYGGLTYGSNEAAFQAQKCVSEAEKRQFTEYSPGKSKGIGRSVRLRPDWEDVKTGIMEEIVRAKFTQHPELAERLLATEDKILVEGNHWGDTCWGVDTRTGQGENRLGRILMKIRDELCGRIAGKAKDTFSDRIRGSLFGGAAGDALGYPIEFWSEYEIFSEYGEQGIQEYAIDPRTGKALISDDTQMSLFTANGILVADTSAAMNGVGSIPHNDVADSYMDWFITQEQRYEYVQNPPGGATQRNTSWLLDVPELYSRRAPGNTCMSALYQKKKGGSFGSIGFPKNHSKGCGGVMRVTPLALRYDVQGELGELDREGAEIAALTHGHPLGYISAAVMVHIINRIVYPKREMELKEIVLEAVETAKEVFSGELYLRRLTRIVHRAVELSENGEKDIDNIHRLGEGWVAEEALAIAVYCALRYQNDFSAGIAAAVNHRGDSDSTGALTGNILGALCGYEAIEEKWKQNLELSDVILEMADDLSCGCRMNERHVYEDPVWIRKYMQMRRYDIQK